uniref:Uncharacterized protein n=1 Tax=Rhizophora mucronata TaxID=61149 RepID=A0A2P2QC54_RHIMU
MRQIPTKVPATDAITAYSFQPWPFPFLPELLPGSPAKGLTKGFCCGVPEGHRVFNGRPQRKELPKKAVGPISTKAPFCGMGPLRLLQARLI